MTAAARLRRDLLGLALTLLAAAAWADSGCRVAFDIGSSGIRAGASNSAAMPQADIDYLGPLWAGGSLRQTLQPTVTALRDLPRAAGFDPDCERVGGGFSAWRLALQQDVGELLAVMAHVRADSGVAVLVVPQAIEGGYAYTGAKLTLGPKLATSHVLDIGGGSLQVADAGNTFGVPLGQKSWHRLLCITLGRGGDVPCTLQPLSGDELAAVRRLARESLQGLEAALPGPVRMTAISRPVTRGVLPALEQLGSPATNPPTLQRPDVEAAIARIAPLSTAETAMLIGKPKHLAAYLISNLLLLEELLRATGSDELQVVDIELNNIAGLLADDRAYAWGRHYGCYLDRLGRIGEQAWASDPATCTDTGPDSSR
jgi:hypothetical protein